MSEEENIGVDAVAEANDAEQSHEQETSEAQPDQQKKDADHNWGEMRRMMREKDQKIEDLISQSSMKAERAPTPDDEDELAKMAEDDILTVAQARKLASKMATTAAEAVMKKRDADTVDDRMQLKYPDYADVVTRENIELLKQTEPELAESLYHSPDPYKQAVSAYKLIKRIAAKSTEIGAVEKKQAAENSQKPLSVNAVTKSSAIGNAHLFENGLTKELKGQLYKEMRDAMKAG